MQKEIEVAKPDEDKVKVKGIIEGLMPIEKKKAKQPKKKENQEEKKEKNQVKKKKRELGNLDMTKRTEARAKRRLTKDKP